MSLRITLAQRLNLQQAEFNSAWLWHLLLRPRGIEAAANATAWVKSQPHIWQLLQTLSALLFVGADQRASLAQEWSRWKRYGKRGFAAALAPARWVAACLNRIDFSQTANGLETYSTRFDAFGTATKSIVAIAAIVLVLLMVTTPLPLWAQFLFFALTIGITLLLRRIPGRFATLAIICLSCVVTLRYAWWRLTSTMNLEYNTDYIMGIPLLLAELYTWIILFLGFLQTAWPLERPKAELPSDESLWPSVDVFIPTYNEPMSVVQPTVLAAIGIDWPRDRLTVYLLDDGNRPEFKEFAERVGVQYIARGYNTHAKAGNLNHALSRSNGDYIAIFDCDHLPVRTFLRATIGWFMKEPKCAIVQTPHNFFSPDPFERNFNNFRRVPNEGELFYGLIQDGNDLWNATFFCGSCAVIKRAPLEKIGGIAVETVTEDAHTALKLHRLGYTTAYLNEIQANGLATESLSGHIGQRIRWARGMAQIFRTDNPLLGKGLSIFQRLCYSNAMLHYFYGIPRLVFLTAPLSYLFFELHIVDAQALALALFAFPHILQSHLANSRLQGRYRFSFWASIYESVLAWYIVVPTTLAFINPKLGKFNVTVKGGLIEKDYFDWEISRPYRVLLMLNFSGLVLGIFRLFWWNSYEIGSVLLNLSWTIFNLVTLGAALGVAAESKQVRRTHRVSTDLPAQIRFAGQPPIDCRLSDFSLGGLGLHLPSHIDCPLGAQVEAMLFNGERTVALPAQVVLRNGDKAGVQFFNLTLQQEIDLLQCTFASADMWAHWREAHKPDQPIKSFFDMIKLSISGYRRAHHYFYADLKDRWVQWATKSKRLFRYGKQDSKIVERAPVAEAAFDAMRILETKKPLAAHSHIQEEENVLT